MGSSGETGLRPRPLGRSDYLSAVVIFATALLLRVMYILQFSSSPLFDSPFGDPLIYYNRALDILAGDLVGGEVYFHSSPPYAYFIALFFRMSGNSLFFLYLVQSVIGAGNCVLISLLTHRLTAGNRRASFLAGLLAAFSGIFVFFEADLLMIFLTLFFVDLSLLLLLELWATGKLRYSLLAGIALAMASLDKTNLLIFVPGVLLFLMISPFLASARIRLKATLLFLGAFALTVLPVTVRNYAVGGDLVLVSSNGGVNFYIGNNAEGRGTFYLPPGSGLTDPGLYESSKAYAEGVVGRELAPSQVSKFWFSRGLDFMVREPGAALKLLGVKFLRLVNGYEYPNHLNYYFVRSNIAPALRWMPVGLWLVFPLSLLGMAATCGGRRNPAALLYMIFLLCYTFSLLPFFITERYRLPMVPLLIVFSAAGIFGLPAIQRKGKAFLAALALAVAAGVFLTSLPLSRVTFARDRQALAAQYFEKSLRHRDKRDELLMSAVFHYKWSLEVEPGIAYGHFNLGLAYENLGFYSGAIERYRRALALDPRFAAALQSARRAASILAGGSDRRTEADMPRTPFERARSLQAAGKTEEAMDIYSDLLSRDPFHYETLNDLGTIHLQRGEREQAARLFRKGLRINPNHEALRRNLRESQSQGTGAQIRG